MAGLVFFFVVAMWLIAVITGVSVINNQHSGDARMRSARMQVWSWPVLGLFLAPIVYLYAGGELWLAIVIFFTFGLVGVYVLLSETIARAAQKKGRDRSQYLWFAALIGPIISGIAVALMSTRPPAAPAPPRNEARDEPSVGAAARTEKRCPFCAEYIRQDAVKCRYCGEWIGEVSQEGGHEQ